MDLSHEQRLTETEARSKSNTKRIDDIDNRFTKRLDEIKKRQDDFGELISTVKILAEKEARVEKDVNDIKESIDEIKEKPGKRWDSLVDKIILTVAAAIVGFFLAQFGLKG